MSFVSGTQAELIWSGPSASYTAVNAVSASAQFLMTGATGAFEQPFIPANFWQMGRRNQRARVEIGGLLTGQGSATTAIFTLGLATAPNTATPGTGGGSLLATAAATVTSLAAVGWRFKADILSRNVGYGTTSVSTSLLTDGEVSIAAVQATGPPTLLSTIDASLQWWVYLTVTFSTSSATNSCQLTRADVWGLN
jgi:hypothetical protein